MGITLPLALEQTHKLTELDPSEDTFVTIRQSRRGDEERLAEIFAESKRAWTPGVDEVTETVNWNGYALERQRAQCVMVECNIMREDDKPLFTMSENVTMSPVAFERAWNQLPDAWAREIYKKIILMNPHWGRTDEEEEGEVA